MSFAALHRLVAYAVAGLGFAALNLGEDLGTGAAVVIGVAYVASFFAEGPLVRSTRWSRSWTIGLIGLFVIQGLRGFFGEPLLGLALETTAALQVSRLMNRRGAREYQQIGALALLQLIAAAALSTELGYALVFLGFVVVLPWMLVVSHLRSEIEGQTLARPEEDRERVLERVLASPRIVGPAFLAATTGLTLPLVVMVGALFVAFPRVGIGMLTFGSGSSQGVSGFGSNVELGDFGVIRTDPTVVLRVTPPDLPNPPPPELSLRMRGTSFEHYDGREWRRGRDLDGQGVGHVGGRYPIPQRLPYSRTDRVWDVVLDALDEPVLFLPPDTVSIEVPTRITGGFEVGRQLEFTPGVDIRYRDGDGLGLRYRAWTSADAAGGLGETLDADRARRYLQIPLGHGRVIELARAWTAGATSDVERAQRLLARLRDSGEYAYSLETPTVGDRLPLDVFLFEAKRGHCEYFATALAIQLRGVGIPSRNVTGFLGGTYNTFGGYYALSQGDAHSWVEAWLPGLGWTVLDPTPSAREEMGPDPGAFAGLREILDALQTRWAEDIVSYDLRRQVSALETLRSWLAASGDGRSEREARRRDDASARSIPTWAWGFFALTIVGGVVVFLAWRRRAGDPIEQLPPHARAAVRLYRLLDRRLTRLGQGRPPARTPLEHVAHLEALGFDGVEVVREVTQRYVDVRFARNGMPPTDAERLEREIARLGER